MARSTGFASSRVATQVWGRPGGVLQARAQSWGGGEGENYTYEAVILAVVTET